MKKFINTFKKIYSIILIGLCLFFIKQVFELNMLPLKYLLIVIGILVLLFVLFIFLTSKKNKVLKFIGVILSIILLSFSIIGNKYLNETITFLNKAFNNNTVEITKYDLVVLKNSKYDDLLSLNNKSIGYSSSIDEKAIEKINTISYKEVIEDDIYGLYNQLTNKTIDAMLIDDAYLDILSDDIKMIYEDTRIVYSFEIETKIDKTNEDISLRPINIYISGSDSRSNTINNKSRSDVNLILTINPYTHEVLTTSIPRDYYVQVHGQTGLKDKLTHAGIYGLATSEATLEDLLDIKIDYSVKINFNAVVEVVDLVGGIDVYSDTEFDSYHYKGWHVKKGMNHMDGEHALAYARERYAYASGDRHRGQNQQQVLEAVMSKVMSDKSLLLQYNDLLSSLSNLYKTTMPKEAISIIVKDQLNKMSKWSFESISADGSNASLETHTAPNTKRYVMVPYEKDIKMIHDRITKLQEKR